jgi:hypothetical protein
MKLRGRRGRLRTLWHITEEKDFRPKPIASSIHRAGYLLGFTRKKPAPRLYATTNPYFWTRVIAWAEGREWAAEIDLLPGHPPIEECPVMQEVELDPKFVQVRRVVPLSQAIAEMKMTPGEVQWAKKERASREGHQRTVRVISVPRIVLKETKSVRPALRGQGKRS